MHVQNDREIPEYEINPREIDFSNSIDITKVIHSFFIRKCLLSSPICVLVFIFSLIPLIR